MAHTSCAKKRLRQSQKRRLRNRSAKSEIKTLTKKLFAYIDSQEAAAAQALFPSLISKIDRAGRRHILHPNAAANRKSRVARRMKALASPTSG
jgi:small subunit ribosomal protein S20